MKNTINSRVTTSLIHDCRFETKHGLFPIKIRVTYQSKQKYYATKFYLSKIDYESLPKTKKNELIVIRESINGLLEHAKEIVNSINEFSFEEFENRYLQKNTSTNKDVFEQLESKASEMLNTNRKNYYFNFKSAIKFFKTFVPKQKWLFKEVTPDILNLIETKAIESKYSVSTIGIYMRVLRVVFYEAISNNLIDSKNLPFGKGKYTPPTATNNPRPILKDDLIKLLAYKSDSEPEMLSLNLFFFSTFCNGLNISDVLRLRFENIHANKIVMIRKKTALKTKANPRPIEAEYSEILQTIVSTYGNKNKDAKNFIFDIVKQNDNEICTVKKIANCIKTTNKYLSRIGTKLNFNRKITTYFARHTFASLVNEIGIDISQISKLLGHSSIEVTKGYISRLKTTENEISNRINNYLKQ